MLGMLHGEISIQKDLFLGLPFDLFNVFYTTLFPACTGVVKEVRSGVTKFYLGKGSLTASLFEDTSWVTGACGQLAIFIWIIS